MYFCSHNHHYKSFYEHYFTGEAHKLLLCVAPETKTIYNIQLQYIPYEKKVFIIVSNLSKLNSYGEGGEYNTAENPPDQRPPILGRVRRA